MYVEEDTYKKKPTLPTAGNCKAYDHECFRHPTITDHHLPLCEPPARPLHDYDRTTTLIKPSNRIVFAVGPFNPIHNPTAGRRRGKDKKRRRAPNSGTP